MNTLPQFQVGDVVALNSGGPPMTVTSTDENYIVAAWFAGDEYRLQPFPLDAVFDIDDDCDEGCDCDNPLGHAG